MKSRINWDNRWTVEPIFLITNDWILLRAVRICSEMLMFEVSIYFSIFRRIDIANGC